MKHKEEFFKIMSEAFDNELPRIVISRGKKQTLIHMVGSPIDLIHLLMDLIKQSPEAAAAMQTALGAWKEQHPDRDEHDPIDCEKCEHDGKCEIQERKEDLLKNVNDNVLDLLMKSGKGYQA